MFRLTWRETRPGAGLIKLGDWASHAAGAEWHVSGGKVWGQVRKVVGEMDGKTNCMLMVNT